MTLCYLLLGLSTATMCAVLFARPFYRAVTAVWDRTSRVNRVAFVTVCLFAALYGGAKHATGKITYPRTDPTLAYLTDKGSYVTNDFVHIDFERLAVVPSSAMFYLDSCGLAETNAQGVATNWVTRKSAAFADLTVPFDFAFEGATNHNWVAYTDWTPGPAVLTNGVWHAYWGLDRKQGRYFIPVRTCVRDGGEVIATPKSKWDYEANDEAYWFKHYAPNTAIRIDLTLPNVKSNEITINPTGDGTDAVTTIDWGDGETTSVALGKSLQTIKHTYASRKEYVIVISDTVSSPCRYGDVNYTDLYFVDSLLRWGDNVTSAESAFCGCENFRRTARWNAKITNVNRTYCDCHNFLGPFYQFNDVTVNCTWTYVRCYVAEGTIPPWGKAVRLGNSTYYSCRKATGIIPPWGESMTDSHYTYYDCQSLSGAWTDDPDELMPSRFTYVVNCVTDASDAIRALFYEDWGGTKKRPTTDE